MVIGNVSAVEETTTTTAKAKITTTRMMMMMMTRGIRSLLDASLVVARRR